MAPFFLPDGRQFIYAAFRGPELVNIYLASLDDTAPTLLAEADAPAVYASGYLLYARLGVLMAHPFDATRGVLTGEGFSISQSSVDRYVAFSASNTGTLVYGRGSILIGSCGPIVTASRPRSRRRRPTTALGSCRATIGASHSTESARAAWTSGPSTSSARSRRGSRLSRRSTTCLSGRPTAVRSRSRRHADGSGSICIGARRRARVTTSRCSRWAHRRSYSRATGPRTVRCSRSFARPTERSSILGCCRSRRAGSPSFSSTAGSTRAKASSPRTASGLRTSRTSPVSGKCT